MVVKRSTLLIIYFIILVSTLLYAFNAFAATLYLGGGQSILNSLNDAKGKAYQVDQTNHLGTTIGGYRYGSDIGYLNLGHASIGHGLYLKTDGLFALYRVSDRVGNVSTFAAVGPYLFAVTVPLGGGAYQDRYGAALMTSLGIQYRYRAWAMRASWERVTTWKNFDEDVVLLSVGRSL